jgi:hypothetical protein
MGSLMTQNERLLHDRAVAIGRLIRRNESDLVEILREVDRVRLFKKFDCSSLFIYAVKYLDLDESIALGLRDQSRSS